MRWLLLVVALGCGAPPARRPASTPSRPQPAAISEARIAADIAWLTADARRGRGSRSPDARATADWLVSELTAAGYHPVRQPISTVPGQDNVIATYGSGERAVVVSAHYDHLGTIDGAIYHGADDNASGVAVALAVARDLAAHHDVRGRVIFAFTGAEEIDLDGARAFVAAPPVPLDHIRVAINLDMVGRHLFASAIDEDGGLAAVGLNDDLDVGDAARAAAEHAGLHLVVAMPGMLSLVGQDHRSDDWAFRDRGVLAVHLSTGINDEYHTPRDTADRLSHPQLLRIARFLRELVAATSGTS
jgi:Zn-dependent M28 family amino/carboxypeptidase